jgi:hypothetical protein
MPELESIAGLSVPTILDTIEGLMASMQGSEMPSPKDLTEPDLEAIETFIGAVSDAIATVREFRERAISVTEGVQSIALRRTARVVEVSPPIDVAAIKDDSEFILACLSISNGDVVTRKFFNNLGFNDRKTRSTGASHSAFALHMNRLIDQRMIEKISATEYRLVDHKNDKPEMPKLVDPPLTHEPSLNGSSGSASSFLDQ